MVVSDFDPIPASFDGPLGDLSRALEQATDAYAAACNRAAIDENFYLKAFHRGWVNSMDVAVTARSKHVDAIEDVTDAKCSWNLSIAGEKAARSKVEELRNRLMAAMNHQRFIGANG